MLRERRAVQAMRERLDGEEEALRNAHASVSGKRAELLGSILPDQLRVQSLNMRMADEQLAVERARTIAQLRAIFPICLLYTSPSPRDATLSRMPSSA